MPGVKSWQGVLVLTTVAFGTSLAFAQLQPPPPPSCEQQLQVCGGWQAEVSALAQRREARLLQACEAQLTEVQKQLSEAKKPKDEAVKPSPPGEETQPLKEGN